MSQITKIIVRHILFAAVAIAVVTAMPSLIGLDGRSVEASVQLTYDEDGSINAARAGKMCASFASSEFFLAKTIEDQNLQDYDTDSLKMGLNVSSINDPEKEDVVTVRVSALGTDDDDSFKKVRAVSNEIAASAPDLFRAASAEIIQPAEYTHILKKQTEGEQQWSKILALDAGIVLVTICMLYLKISDYKSESDQDCSEDPEEKTAEC